MAWAMNGHFWIAPSLEKPRNLPALTFMNDYNDWGFLSWLEMVLLMALLIGPLPTALGDERQVTQVEKVEVLPNSTTPSNYEPRNYELDNNDNFSPDDRFLVFDMRTDAGGIGASGFVGKVEIESGKIIPLYRPQQPNAWGPGVGAASYSHQRDEVIFIHGPFHPSGPETQYE